MKNFILLSFIISGEPVWVNVDKIVAFWNNDDGTNAGYTYIRLASDYCLSVRESVDEVRRAIMSLSA